MLTSIYFVRHAHSTYTPDEYERPLSEHGFQAMRTVTDLLQSEHIDEVYSSPYKRAVQTVEGIASFLGIEINIMEDFKERVLAQKSVEDFSYAITKVWEDYDFSWPGGESNRLAQKRGVDATMAVLDHHPGKNIVIGTHGNMMALIMNSFDGQYGFEFWKELDMPDIYKLSFEGKNLSAVQRVWRRD